MSEVSFKPASQKFTKQDAIQFLINNGELPTQSKVAALINQQIPNPESSFETAEYFEQQTEVKDTEIEPNVVVLKTTDYTPRKITVSDFITHYRNRYGILKQLVFNKPECKNATSVNNLKLLSGREKSTIIAMILSAQKLPTGTLKLVLEDLTGTVSAIVSSKNPDILRKANLLSNDEVLGFKGSYSGKTFFVDDLIWPEVPIKPIRKSPDEVYAAFTSDLHFGSIKFMGDKFDNFIRWLNGESEDPKQVELAKKTKYIFIPGDIVDGIGQRPDQEPELNIRDIYEQYNLAAEYFRRVPKDKYIIMMPGNHDAVRIEEPQPQLDPNYAKALYDIPNVIMVGNPSLINIHSNQDFSGFNILMYHGFSFHYYARGIEALYDTYDNPSIVLSYLLARRHLAPAHGCTPRLPLKEDPHLITKIPDIIAIGDLHKAQVSDYNGVTIIVCSCWQHNTSFQDKVGLKSEPAKVPLVNLKTRKVTILDFN